MPAQLSSMPEAPEKPVNFQKISPIDHARRRGKLALIHAIIALEYIDEWWVIQ